MTPDSASVRLLKSGNRVRPAVDTRSKGYGAAMAGSPGESAQELADEVVQLRAENEMLRVAAARHNRIIGSLQASSQTVMQELDTTALLRFFARCGAQVVRAEWTMLCTVDQGSLRMDAAYPEGCGDILFRRYHTVLAKALLRKRAYLCDPPDGDGRPNSPSGAQHRQEHPIPTAGGRLLVVPVLDHKKELIGLLLMQKGVPPNEFCEDGMRAIEILALQFSTAFSRSKLFDRLSDWSQSLEKLLAFNVSINQHLHPSELIKKLVENAAGFLKADGGTAGLALPSLKDGELAMASEAYFYQGEWLDFARQWGRNEGVPGHILASEFFYLSNNFPDDPIADPEWISRFNPGRVLCVPIKNVDKKLLGFFALHKNRRSAPFTWQDAAFLESLGNSTAVAIQNAQLLKTLEVKGEEVRALSAAHVRNLEEERRHIARELHDEAGQVLVGIKLGLQVLARKIPSGFGDLSGELDRLRGLVNQSSTQLRDLAHYLRPPTLDQLGLDMVMRQLASDHEQRSGVSTSLLFEELPEVLPDQVKTALYRIAQEALTNIAKHAEAKHITMKMENHPNGLTFSIHDDGRGFDTAEAGSGLGLLGMKERAGMLGGQLSVRSSRKEGTEICVLIPLQ